MTNYQNRSSLLLFKQNQRYALQLVTQQQPSFLFQNTRKKEKRKRKKKKNCCMKWNGLNANNNEIK